jgi:hypothetical protein
VRPGIIVVPEIRDDYLPQVTFIEDQQLILGRVTRL